ADVEGRGDLPDRQTALPDRAHAAHHGPGRGRYAIARRRPEAPRHTAPRRPLPGAAAINVFADVIRRRCVRPDDQLVVAGPICANAGSCWARPGLSGDDCKWNVAFSRPFMSYACNGSGVQLKMPKPSGRMP